MRPCSIVDPNHFVNMAEKRANEMNEQAKETGSLARGYFCRQFEVTISFNLEIARSLKISITRSNFYIIFL